MSLTTGQTLGAYTVGPLLGSGGMGEVYQAHDTRLGRSVALKVLPDAVAHDRDRLARFTREAQALAALNHPRIAQIYVQPFPGPGAKVQVSLGGGLDARWSRDGRELFYIAPGRRYMVVSVDTRGPTVKTGSARMLFVRPTDRSYVPSPDGQRFLVVKSISAVSPITILLNWKPPGS